MARTTRCPSCGATATTAAVQTGACSYCASALVLPPAGGAPAPPGSARVSGGSRPLAFILALLVLGGAGSALILAAGRGGADAGVPASAPPPVTKTAVAEPPAPEEPAAAPEPAPSSLPEPETAPIVPEVPAPPPPKPSKGERLAALPAGDWRKLNGCLCRVNLDGKPGAETVQLALHHLGSNTSITAGGTRHEHLLGFAVFAGGAPVVLATTLDTAPPASLIGGRMGVGVACSAGKLVVASQGAVTAWSLTDWTALWSTPLDGTFPRGQAEEGGLSLNCATIHEKRGVLVIEREGDRPLRVQVSDGSVAQ